MSAKEFYEWQEYYKLEPFISDRNELQNAMFMQLFSNSKRGENTKPFQIGDFLITYKKEEKKQTLAQQIQEAMKKIKGS